MQVTASHTFSVGTAAVVESRAPEGSLSAVFEDDGDTGYFYALDAATSGNLIQDAVQIYNVRDCTNAHKPSVVEIGWSDDSMKVALLINGYPHAVFDFQVRRGYCRTGFPNPTVGSLWSPQGHEWHDAAMGAFA